MDKVVPPLIQIVVDSGTHHSPDCGLECERSVILGLDAKGNVWYAEWQGGDLLWRRSEGYATGQGAYTRVK